MNEYLVNKADLDAVADDINSILGTTSAISFPSGFRSKLAEISDIITNSEAASYPLTVTISNMPFTQPSGAYYSTAVGSDVYSGMPSTIRNDGTLEHLFMGAATSTGPMILSVGVSSSGATASMVTIDADLGYYLLRISNPTGAVNIIITGTVPS